MQKKRLLVIIIRENFLYFILAGLSEEKIVPLYQYKIRIFDQAFHFSISEYLLKCLESWGQDIGVNIVNEMVPNMGGVAADGIDELFILSYKKFEGLEDITSHIFYFGEKNTPEGAKNIVDILEFSNLIYFSDEEDKISLTHYSQTKEGSVKVKTHYKEFQVEDYSEDIEFMMKYLSDKEDDFASRQLDMMLNKKLQPYALSWDQDTSLKHFLIKIRRYSDLTKNKKFDLKDFGTEEMNENILVIGGVNSSIESNLNLEMLSIVYSLGLTGNFKIYIDRFGVFNFLQKGKRQVFSDVFVYKFLFEFWKNYIKIDYEGNTFNYEEVLADADLIEEGIEKQIIPMLGKILNIKVDDEVDLRFKLFDNSFIENKSGIVEYKKMKKDFVIDSTGSLDLLQKAERKEKLIDLYLNWLKSVKAVK